MAVWQVSSHGNSSRRDGLWDGPTNSFYEVPDGIEGANMLKAYLEHHFPRLIMFHLDECGPMMQGSVEIGPRRIWLTATPLRINKVRIDKV